MSVCAKCGRDFQIGQWFDCPHGRVTHRPPVVHQRERAVKYYHPEHGYRTPGRADRPMPERLKQAGFTTVEFPTLRSLERHSKQTDSRAEVLDYDDHSSKSEKQYG